MCPTGGGLRVGVKHLWQGRAMVVGPNHVEGSMPGMAIELDRAQGVPRRVHLQDQVQVTVEEDRPGSAHVRR